jgi:broad specificity phosphatase PhoE
MILYLIRHAEMAGDPFCCPTTPVSGCLSEPNGIEQASQTAKMMAEKQIDFAISSSYGRALQTAEIVLGSRDIPIKTVHNLHEWYPNLELDKIPSTEFSKMQTIESSKFAEETWKTQLGEGTFDMYARIIPAFLESLSEVGLHQRYGGWHIDEASRDKNIAIFAHGGSLNTILSFILKIPPFPIGSFSFEHTGVAEIKFIENNNVFYPSLVIKTL